MISPMLCCEVSKEQAEKEQSNAFIYQVKFDGIRAFIHIENNKISKIINRTGNNITKQFPEFLELSFNFNGILDAEVIVVANGKDYGDFSSGISYRTHLKDSADIWARAKNLQAKIMTFDIIELNKEDLRFKPLITRLELLKINVKNNELIEVAKNYDDFKELWIMVEKDKLEGCIRKLKMSAYEGVRSKYQVKIKNWKEEQMEYNAYEVAVSTKGGFYKGITLKNDEGNRVAVMGKKSEEVKRIIDTTGKIKIVQQFLEKTKEGRSRFVSFKEIAVEVFGK